MHARDLLEIAAVLAQHAAVIVRGPALAERAVEHYWSASKCRLDRWGHALHEATASLSADIAAPRDAMCAEQRLLPSEGVPAPATPAPQQRVAWPALRGVVEEVLAGEVLTRVVAAVFCSCDRRRGAAEYEPVARSVLIGHLEARHRVLMLLVRSQTIAADEALRLNHLRKRAERWTDLLIGRLAIDDDVSEFAIEPERAREFADELRRQRAAPAGDRAWPLLLASLRATFRTALAAASPNGDLNARIAESVCAAFDPALFDGVGLVRSLWMWRLTQVADDAHGMIEVLLSSPPDSAATAPGFLRTHNRGKRT